jgi:hypothetical protein
MKYLVKVSFLLFGGLMVSQGMKPPSDVDGWIGMAGYLIVVGTLLFFERRDN